MDPSSEKKDPAYLRAWKGLAFAIVLLVLLGLMGSYLLKPAGISIPDNVSNSPAQPVTGAPDSGAPAVTARPENNIELRGTQVCLSHIDTSGPQTMECAIGLKADDGSDYGLDTSLLQPDAVGEMAGGARVRIVGHFTPAEALSTDYFHKYRMRGIVQITLIERI